jgi:hypothetical protein
VRELGTQIVTLFLLAIPIACVAWTVTHEEVLREPRQYCERQSRNCPQWYKRKFFYLFTCEFCFSHYVALLFLFVTRFKLLYADWRGYLLAFFALVWIANQYMSVYNRLRLDIKGEKIEHEIKQEIAVKEKSMRPTDGNSETASPRNSASKAESDAGTRGRGDAARES